MSAATQISHSTRLQPAHETKELCARTANISAQAAVYFAGTVLTAAAGYFFKVYVARTLGAEALGLYALGMSIVGFLGLFNAFGLPAAAARFIPQYSRRGEFSRLGAFLCRSLAALSAGNVVLCAGILLAGPWVAERLYHAPELRGYFGAFALIMLFGVLNTFLGQCMAGYQDVARRTLITHFIGTPANILLAIVLIGLGWGLRGYLAAQIVSAAAVFTCLAASVWKMTPSAARGWPRQRLERNVISFSGAAFALSAMDFTLAQSDKIVLGCFLAAKQVGIYATAMAVVSFVPIALQSVNQIFSPTIAELHAAGDVVLLQKLYSTLTKWILIFTLPLVLAMVSFPRPLMEIFGPAFAGGASILVIGAAAQLINCGVGSVGYLLLMSGNQGRVVQIQAANSVALIALSVALVPRYGMMGAAVAGALTVVSTNLWSLLAVRRHLGLFPYHAGYLKLLPCALVAYGAQMLFARLASGVHSPWEFAAGGLLCSYVGFFGALLLFGLEEEDRALRSTLWKRATQNFRGDEAMA